MSYKRVKGLVQDMMNRIENIIGHNKPFFVINNPQIILTRSENECIRSINALKIHCENTGDGHICFEGDILFTKLHMCIKLHFKNEKLENIELFRPKKYLEGENYDINKSFAEIHNAIEMIYGKPSFKSTKASSGFPLERWYAENLIIEHYITECSGFDEHFNVRFA